MTFIQYARRVINILLVVFAFLLPLSKPASNAVLVLIVLAWIIEGRWQDKVRILRQNKVFITFGALIGWMGLSLLWSDTLSGGFFKGHDTNALVYYLRLNLFDFLLLPVMLTSLETRYIRYILSVFLSAMLLSEIVSWGIFFELIHYKDVPSYDPSPFMHHSLYSVFLAVTIFLLASLMGQTDTWRWRLFYGVFMLSATANLFLNGGRLGQIAFVVGVAVYALSVWRSTLKAAAIMAVVGGGVVTAAYFTSPVFQTRADTTLKALRHISEGKYNTTSWGIRVNILRVGAQTVRQHPIVGSGIGAAKSAFLEQAQRFDQTGMFPDLEHLHNQYLQLLVQTGLVGLGLLGWLFAALWRTPLPSHKRAFYVTFLALYAVGFIGEPLLDNRQPYLLFILFAVLWIRESQASKEAM